nr:MAG TPA: hypothetical protein [Caudoviricetes sp.]
MDSSLGALSFLGFGRGSLTQNTNFDPLFYSGFRSTFASFWCR